MLNSSTAHIAWRPLEAHQFGPGTPLGYQIQIISRDSWYRDLFNTTLQASEVYIHNLTENESYDVQLAALSSKGLGPFGPPTLIRIISGYEYDSASAPLSSSSPGDSASSGYVLTRTNRLVLITRDPLFITSAVISMFLICAILIVVLTRRRLSWKKNVANYLTVQLRKCDQLEKCGLNGANPGINVSLNGCGVNSSLLLDGKPNNAGSGSLACKTSWLASNFKYGTATSGHSEKLFNLVNGNTRHYSLSSAQNSHHLKQQYMAGGTSIHQAPDQETMNSSIVGDAGEREYAETTGDNGYYAEVEGHSMVTFGKKDYPSTAPYATTTLMNAFRRVSDEPLPDSHGHSQPPLPPPPLPASSHASIDQYSRGSFKLIHQESGSNSSIVQHRCSDNSLSSSSREMQKDAAPMSSYIFSSRNSSNHNNGCNDTTSFASQNKVPNKLNASEIDSATSTLTGSGGVISSERGEPRIECGKTSTFSSSGHHHYPMVNKNSSSSSYHYASLHQSREVSTLRAVFEISRKFWVKSKWKTMSNIQELHFHCLEKI